MNIADIFRQAEDVQARANAMQEQLALIEAEGVAGAGLVKLVLNGKAELKSLSIDPSLLRPDGREIVQDLVVAAHTDARGKWSAGRGRDAEAGPRHGPAARHDARRLDCHYPRRPQTAYPTYEIDYAVGTISGMTSRLLRR